MFWITCENLNYFIAVLRQNAKLCVWLINFLMKMEPRNPTAVLQSALFIFKCTNSFCLEWICRYGFMYIMMITRISAAHLPSNIRATCNYSNLTYNLLLQPKEIFPEWSGRVVYGRLSNHLSMLIVSQAS